MQWILGTQATQKQKRKGFCISARRHLGKITPEKARGRASELSIE